MRRHLFEVLSVLLMGGSLVFFWECVSKLDNRDYVSAVILMGIGLARGGGRPNWHQVREVLTGRTAVLLIGGLGNLWGALVAAVLLLAIAVAATHETAVDLLFEPANQGMDLAADLAAGWGSFDSSGNPVLDFAQLAQHYLGPVRKAVSGDGRYVLYYLAGADGSDTRIARVVLGLADAAGTWLSPDQVAQAVADDGVDLPTTGPGTTKGVEIVLQPRPVVRGVVRSAIGRPVLGGRVVVGTHHSHKFNEATHWDEQPEGRVAADGSYEVPVVTGPFGGDDHDMRQDDMVVLVTVEDHGPAISAPFTPEDLAAGGNKRVRLVESRDLSVTRSELIRENFNFTGDCSEISPRFCFDSPKVSK